MAIIPCLNPDTYEPHTLHKGERVWAETNCYVDVLIELIHALGREPLAALPMVFRTDFEIDQWTFYKFALADLDELYGMEVQELNPWGSLAEHVQEQVAHGRPVLIELDSYYLPDTAGVAYRCVHQKSTVAVNDISIAEQRMGYFHGQGYYQLEGTDFVDIFQLDGLIHERMLPPYVELIKVRGHCVNQKSTLEKSIGILRRELASAPRRNPFQGFRNRFRADLEWLSDSPMEVFHRYAFATFRQFGTCFELAQVYLEWLGGQGEEGLAESVDAFTRISSMAKIYQFQLARAMARNKPLPLTPIDDMGDCWQNGMDHLHRRFS